MAYTAARPEWRSTRRPRHVSDYTKKAITHLELTRKNSPAIAQGRPPLVSALPKNRCPSKIERRAVLFAKRIAGKAGSAPGKNGYRKRECK